MVISETKNPDSTLILADEIETGSDEIGKLPTRLERYAVAKQRALINLAQVDFNLQITDSPIFKNHLISIRSRMVDCGNYLVFRDYYTVGQVKLTAARFCMTHLLCPLCAIRRGSKMVESYVQKYQVIMLENPDLKMSMITFTVKNGDDLSKRHKHLKNSIHTLMKRSRDYKHKGTGYTEFSKVLGLIGTYEVTKDGGKGKNKHTGWHPHVHLMVLHRTRIDATALKAEWLNITGDSHVLRIDPARHPNDPGIDFLEVCKYALKFSDLTPEQNFHAYEVLRGKRLIISAGLFWGVEIPTRLTDEPLENLPYFERLYSFILGVGYSLKTVTDSIDKPDLSHLNFEPKKQPYKPKSSKKTFVDTLVIPQDVIDTAIKSIKGI